LKCDAIFDDIASRRNIIGIWPWDNFFIVLLVFYGA